MNLERANSPRAAPRRGFLWDVAVVALFGLAAFSVVAVALAIRHPDEEQKGVMALVLAPVGAVGAWPALAGSAALTFLIVRLWLGGIAAGLLRNALGVAGAALALSVLAGALSPGAGGSLGELTGGSVARQIHPSVGAIFGLVALAIPVWFAWLRPREWRGGENRLRPAPTASSVAESEGLSLAEAEALLPRARGRSAPSLAPGPAGADAGPPGPQGGTSAPQAQSKSPWAAGASLAPSPYPPDVRLSGGIPKGARPLETTTHERRSQSPSAGTPGDDAPLADRPPAGIARAHEPAASHLAAPDHGSAAPAPGPGATGASRDRSAPSERVAAAPAPDRMAVEERPSGVAAREPAGARPEEGELPTGTQAYSPTSPPAAWEQPDLYAETPVDAYGTPLALVEELRAANEEARRAIEREEEDEDLAEDLAPAGAAEAAAEDGSLVEMDGEVVEIEDGEADEAEPFAAPPAGEAQQVGAALELDELAAPHEEEPAGAADLAPELATAAAAQDASPLVEQRSLFEGGEPRRAAASEEPAAEAAPAAEMAPAAKMMIRDVVLEPRAAPRPQRSEKPLSDLVLRAGELFIGRQRVAVSMLQREFGLDFKQATAVLDQLQEAGLIGPYLGGQRRDILLTLEQWKERAGAAV